MVGLSSVCVWLIEYHAIHVGLLQCLRLLHTSNTMYNCSSKVTVIEIIYHFCPKYFVHCCICYQLDSQLYSCEAIAFLGILLLLSFFLSYYLQISFVKVLSATAGWIFMNFGGWVGTVVLFDLKQIRNGSGERLSFYAHFCINHNSYSYL